MDKLIEALQIFLKYGNPRNPTHCEHDVMYICGIDHNAVSDEDIKTLDKLGFFLTEEGFQSFKYGNC